jgi:hypothetical protein
VDSLGARIAQDAMINSSGGGMTPIDAAMAGGASGGSPGGLILAENGQARRSYPVRGPAGLDILEAPGIAQAASPDLPDGCDLPGPAIGSSGRTSRRKSLGLGVQDDYDRWVPRTPMASRGGAGDPPG